MDAVPPLSEPVRLSLPRDVQAYVASLEAIVAEVPTLRAAVVVLHERIAALEARLGQTSRNSSRPPSSDPPGRLSPPPSTPSGRRPGGQPGHPGQTRVVLAPEQVDQIVRCVPTACAACGAALAAAADATDGDDERWQVTELPPVAATVTEYQVAVRRCSVCDHRTRGLLPPTIGASRFGPRLTAVTALLTGRYRLSKREAAACVGDLFAVDVAVGSVSAVEQRVSAALSPVVADAQTAVQRAAVVNMDETGWREQRRRAWLWTAVTATATVFQIHASRGGAVARTLLGPAWSGIVGSDRGTMYAWVDRDRRQVCWAHLKRDFQKLVDWGPGPRPLGERLLTLHGQVFDHWHRFRAGDLDRAGLQAALTSVQADLTQVLTDGAAHGHAVAQPLCRNLLTLGPALWTFGRLDGVEPTNNAAEQALRPAVLWRKGSFGTHSPAGSRFVERMLTVSASCRQQHRPLLDLLVAALTAQARGTPPPSLITPALA